MRYFTIRWLYGDATKTGKKNLASMWTSWWWIYILAPMLRYRDIKLLCWTTYKYCVCVCVDVDTHTMKNIHFYDNRFTIQNLWCFFLVFGNVYSTWWCSLQPPVWNRWNIFLNRNKCQDRKKNWWSSSISKYYRFKE